MRKLDAPRARFTVEQPEVFSEMDYAETRELIRIRHELRRLLSERPAGANVAARALISRIECLVAADAEEAKVIVPELARWQVSLAVS
jgi:hypothetical protein